jgi:hypothetical protein
VENVLIVSETVVVCSVQNNMRQRVLRETERETDRECVRVRERQTETETDRQRERVRERERERESRSRYTFQSSPPFLAQINLLQR